MSNCWLSRVYLSDAEHVEVPMKTKWEICQPKVTQQMSGRPRNGSYESLLSCLLHFNYWPNVLLRHVQFKKSISLSPSTPRWLFAEKVTLEGLVFSKMSETLAAFGDWLRICSYRWGSHGNLACACLLALNCGSLVGHERLAGNFELLRPPHPGEVPCPGGMYEE